MKNLIQRIFLLSAISIAPFLSGCKSFTYALYEPYYKHKADLNFTHPSRQDSKPHWTFRFQFPASYEIQNIFIISNAHETDILPIIKENQVIPKEPFLLIYNNTSINQHSTTHYSITWASSQNFTARIEYLNEHGQHRHIHAKPRLSRR